MSETAAERCATCGAELGASPEGLHVDAVPPADLTSVAVTDLDEGRDTEVFRMPPPEAGFRGAARAIATPPPRRAGFVRRAIAFVIDGVILGIFTVPLTIAGLAGVKAALIVEGTTVGVADEDVLTSLVSYGWFVMAMIYFTALHRVAGQTIGKAIVGIRVLTTDFAAIGTLRSAVRSFGYVVSSTVFGLGFLMVALTPEKRGWHDYLAGTCVVRLAPDES